MDMPQPTEAHKKLELLAGVWTGDEHMQPSQWCPEATTAQGRTESHLTAGGFAVTAEYTQSKDGVVTFSGHGVYSYDSRESCYRLHWWDSMGSGPEVFTGRFEGDTLIMESQSPMGHMRMTGDYSESGKLTSKMEMSPDGGDWTLMFDGVYTRE